MSTQMTAGADGRTVAAPGIGALPVGRGMVRPAGTLPLWQRGLRGVGRVVLGLPPSTWLLLDTAIIAVAVYVAYWVFPPPGLLETRHIELWEALSIFAFALILASLVFGLYERETFMSRSRTLTRMLLTTTTATVIAYAVIYVIMYATVSRRVSGLAMSMFCACGVSVRLAAWWVAHQVHCGLLVVGTRELYDSLVAAQGEGLLHEYRFVGYAVPNTEQTSAPHLKPCVGPIADQIHELGHLGVTDIVVSDGVARDPSVMAWMGPCLQRGCRVTNEATFYEKATGQILVDEITPAWFLSADLKVHCDQQATLKRIMDLVLAATGLCLTVAVWPIIGLAIKLCDGGPVFYSQDRVGQNGRVFRLHKFRTMRIDAENGKSVWSSPNDPRVTRVGRFLRRTRLDELPQLYDALLGRMSIVGPRPERPDFVRDLSEHVPFYAQRHLVKPGITGWAQISFRYGSSIADARRKTQFDLYYLKHMSFELDLIILFRTVGTFLRGGC